MDTVHINRNTSDQSEQERLALSLQQARVAPETGSIMEENTLNQSEEHFVDEKLEEPVAEKEPVAENAVSAVEVSETEQPVVQTTEELKVSNRKQQNVTITENISYKDTWDPYGDTATLPASFDEEMKQALNSVPNVNILNDPKTREWLQIVSEGSKASTFNDGFIPTLEDSAADYFQSIELNGTKLAGAQPKFKQLENQTLTGERAAIRLMSHLGLGTLFQVPLWHSGIWITFKAPTESEIIELNRRGIADKIAMGRSSYGLAFSNTASYTTDRIIDFALDHVYDTSININEIPSSDLKNWIDSQDIPSLIWGFICTMYPKGFQYRRACVADPEKCNHVVEEMLNVSKLQWTNRLALTDWQKTHMSSRRSNTKDKASIKRYKEEMLKTQKRRVTFNEGTDAEIAITLKTPTIGEYVDAGHRWVSEIIEMVDQALGQEIRDNERNEYILKHAQASSMRQYVHWVESIEMGSNIIVDMESIENSFNMLSSHNDIRNKFIEETVRYINESTISVIGIPVYDCPVCKTPQDEQSFDLPQHKNIIPLDMIQLFFVLLTQRLLKIEDR